MKRLFLLLAVGLVLTGASLCGAADDKPDDSAGIMKTTDRQAVSWDKLGPCIPETVEGMEAGKLEGGTMQIPDMQNPGKMFSYSHAVRKFTKDDKEITVTITDTDYNAMLLAPFMSSIEYDGSDGAIKSVEISGQPGKLMIDKEDGETTDVMYLVLVGGCILVTVEGNEGVSQDDVESVTKKVDFGTLTGLTGN